MRRNNGSNSIGALNQNTLVLAMMAAILVIASQGVNFVDAIVSICIKSGFIKGKPYTYISVIFSSLSLVITIVAYITLRKLFRFYAAKVIFFFILAFFSFIYVLEIQLYSTNKNVALSLFRYSNKQCIDLCRNRL